MSALLTTINTSICHLYSDTLATCDSSSVAPDDDWGTCITLDHPITIDGERKHEGCKRFRMGNLQELQNQG